ncbi:MAG: preprotein translocase subunit Sec61beta [Nitrososphaeraceae archaeon]|jgi:preprotein translocase subunit Sec61beta|nr:preprotein translocase subunit Sec61beta [Nitrososphaeraceae archaeon]MDW0255216.1 preprotein translocase subunit Sec61beta [Nitrososphaeraceae archaeon]MDW0293059.1 preprotein translocase subunit Sec61beta [Nitrososphaeraceae archaeon]MDW0329589.1 preprotein translocase subunit Sec61beta [Nitrososphaeraceae archaeon]
MYLRDDSSRTFTLGEGKKKNAPLPASSAGLLRFFEDETRGVKVKPEVILGVTGALIGISIIIRIVFPV